MINIFDHIPLIERRLAVRDSATPVAPAATQRVGEKLPLSAARLRHLFEYDAAAGSFVRLVTVRGNARAGYRAGFQNRIGYVIIRVDGVQYKAHRLAWLYMTGSWPAGHIDHINGARSDNRFANLREATDAENVQNVHRPSPRNSSGFLGVSAARGKWRASIMRSGRSYFLGEFATPELASAAYLAAKRDLHPFWIEPVPLTAVVDWLDDMIVEAM